MSTVRTDRSGPWRADLFALLAYVVAVDVLVLVVDLPSSLLRTAVVLPLALFAPGYALLALVYPERHVEATPRSRRNRDEADDGVLPEAGLPFLARVLLSVALSLVIVPLVVFVLNFVVGIYLAPMLLGVSAVTVLLAASALALRAELPESERFVLPDLRQSLGGGRRGSRGLGSGRNRSSGVVTPMTILVGVSVLALLGSVAFAAALPLAGVSAPGHTDFTEFYLLSQNESGQYNITDHPQQFAPGESRPVYVAIGNQEGAGDTVDYTVVVQLQRVRNEQVQEAEELTRFSREVDNGETVRVRHDLQPSMEGENLRVVYLLYRGDVPEDPSRENAYRSTRLWITVGDGDGGGQRALSTPASLAATGPGHGPVAPPDVRAGATRGVSG